MLYFYLFYIVKRLHDVFVSIGDLLNSIMMDFGLSLIMEIFGIIVTNFEPYVNFIELSWYMMSFKILQRI